MIVRIGLHVGVVVAGLVVGVIGGFVQSQRFILDGPWGRSVVPWGVVLMLVALLLLIRGAVWLVHGQRGGWLFLAGWIIGTFVVATESPSGDLAISSGTRQWVYVLAGVVLGAAASTFPVSTRSSLTIDEHTPPSP